MRPPFEKKRSVGLLLWLNSMVYGRYNYSPVRSIHDGVSFSVFDGDVTHGHTMDSE